MERPLRDRPTMHDLVLSKLEAGRQKDIDFARSAARLRLLQCEELLLRLQGVARSDGHRQQMSARINALFT
jgi:hypothetical protein